MLKLVQHIISVLHWCALHLNTLTEACDLGRGSLIFPLTKICSQFQGFLLIGKHEWLASLSAGEHPATICSRYTSQNSAACSSSPAPLCTHSTWPQVVSSATGCVSVCLCIRVGGGVCVVVELPCLRADSWELTPFRCKPASVCARVCVYTCRLGEHLPEHRLQLCTVPCVSA